MKFTTKNSSNPYGSDPKMGSIPYERNKAPFSLGQKKDLPALNLKHIHKSNRIKPF